MAAMRPFRVGLTRDFLTPEGELVYGDIGLGLLDAAPGVEYEFFAQHSREVRPEQVADYDAVIALGVRFTAQAFSATSSRLALIARFGVGYDNIDLAACTAAGVAVTITPDGVRRPVATAILTFILVLAQKLPAKERLARSGRWDQRPHHLGIGLTGRTVGLIGVGNIGRDFFRLVQPFEMVHLAFDPYVRPDAVAPLGVRLVDLPTLLRESDFVCVNCPLTHETRHLLGTRELALMKPTAYLINTARGAIVDEKALYLALHERRIAGAALDVFEQEPTPADNPLLHLDNVVVTPHAIVWTDECFLGNGTAACQSVLSVARGEVPRNVVNQEVLEHPDFRRRLAEFARASHARRGGQSE